MVQPCREPGKPYRNEGEKNEKTKKTNLARYSLDFGRYDALSPYVRKEPDFEGGEGFHCNACASYIWGTLDPLRCADFPLQAGCWVRPGERTQ